MAFDTNQPAFKQLSKTLAEKLRPLVLWVGAGMSSPHLPGWTKLYDALLLAAERKLASLQGGADGRGVYRKREVRI